MTNSDSLIIAAIRAKVPLKFNNREVVHTGDVTTVILHGKACIVVNRKNSSLELHGDCRPSRKTCRLFNSVLSDYTSYRAYSQKERWYLKTGHDHKDLPFTDEIVSIPVSLT